MEYFCKTNCFFLVNKSRSNILSQFWCETIKSCNFCFFFASFDLSGIHCICILFIILLIFYFTTFLDWLVFNNILEWIAFLLQINIFFFFFQIVPDFSFVKNSIEEVEIRSSCLRSLKGNNLQNLAFLNKLILSNNYIEFIDPNVFKVIIIFIGKLIFYKFLLVFSLDIIMTNNIIEWKQNSLYM